MPDDLTFIQKPEQKQLFHQHQRQQRTAPDKEIQLRAVPQRRQAPHHDQVQKRPRLSFPVTPQGDIYILPEPAAQCDMPPPPEFRNRFGHIREMKILRDGKAQHFADAYGHHGITREIKIQLQRVAKRPHPRQRCGNAVKADGLDVVPQKADPVCHQHLRSQSQDQHAQALFQPLRRQLPFPQRLPDFPVIHDGAGGQLRKHGQIGAQL